MSTKPTQKILTDVQQKHLLNRIGEITRRNPPNLAQSAAVVSAKKKMDALRKIVETYDIKNQKHRDAWRSRQYKAAIKARDTVYFPKSAAAALQAVEALDKAFPGSESRSQQYTQS